MRLLDRVIDFDSHRSHDGAETGRQPEFTFESAPERLFQGLGSCALDSCVADGTSHVEVFVNTALSDIHTGTEAAISSNGMAPLDPSPGAKLDELAAYSEHEEPQRVEMEPSHIAMSSILQMLNYRSIEETGTPVPIINPLPSKFMNYTG